MFLRDIVTGRSGAQSGAGWAKVANARNAGMLKVRDKGAATLVVVRSG
jgi:hypothetical protein